MLPLSRWQVFMIRWPHNYSEGSCRSRQQVPAALPSYMPLTRPHQSTILIDSYSNFHSQSRGEAHFHKNYVHAVPMNTQHLTRKINLEECIATATNLWDEPITVYEKKTSCTKWKPFIWISAPRLCSAIWLHTRMICDVVWCMLDDKDLNKP